MTHTWMPVPSHINIMYIFIFKFSQKASLRSFRILRTVVSAGDWDLEARKREWEFLFSSKLLLEFFFYHWLLLYNNKIPDFHKHLSLEPFILGSTCKHCGDMQARNHHAELLRQTACHFMCSTDFSRLLISFMKCELLMGLGRGASLMIFQCHQHYALK